MSDTLMRQWQMLRLIPRQPSKISTTELMHRLADEGFTTTQRTLQRNLTRLSTVHPRSWIDAQFHPDAPAPPNTRN